MEVLQAVHYLKSDQDINIHVATVEDVYATHKHDFIEMVFILSGKGTHIIDGVAYPIEKGDVFIVNKNIPHSYQAFPGCPIKVYNCIFQPEFIAGMLSGYSDFVDTAYRYLFHSLSEEKTPKKYIKIIGVDTYEIKVILDEIRDEYVRHQKGYLHIIRAEMIRMLILIFRLYYAEKKKRREHGPYRKILVEHTLEYMRKHYKEPITCEQLAGREYISSSYFSRIFHEETGYSVIQMLQRVRIEAAVELLQTTVFTVDMIAEKVGYSDLKHFYKIFKKITGHTPGRYRRHPEK